MIPEKKNHLFKKGQSGNPTGRPKGTKNEITIQKLLLESDLRKQLGRDIRDVLAVAVKMALAGDQAMIKLLIDKALPTSKAHEAEDVQNNKIEVTINGLPSREAMRVVNVIEGEKSVN